MKSNELIFALQGFRIVLDDMPNCEDSDEMVAMAQELSADIDSLESKILEEGVE